MFAAIRSTVKFFTQHLSSVPVTLLLTLAALTLMMVPDVQLLLQFDRGAIATGEFWRMVTGHVTHWNADHCLWDVSVFFGLGALCERRHRRAFLACLGGSIVLTSAYMQWFQATLPTYRGLSGIDTGLFALWSCCLIRDAVVRGDRKMVLLTGTAVTGLAIKTAWEFFTQATVFVASAGAFIPVPMAHVLGAVAGLVAALTMNGREAVFNLPRQRRAASKTGPVAS